MSRRKVLDPDTPARRRWVISHLAKFFPFGNVDHVARVSTTETVEIVGWEIRNGVPRPLTDGALLRSVLARYRFPDGKPLLRFNYECKETVMREPTTEELLTFMAQTKKDTATIDMLGKIGRALPRSQRGTITDQVGAITRNTLKRATALGLRDE